MSDLKMSKYKHEYVAVPETTEEAQVSVSQDVKPNNWRDLASFWICGLLNNFGYVVMLSAALELLPKDVSPSVVLLAEILPSFIIQLVAPWFMNRLPYSIRVIATVIMAISSFLIPAFCKPTWLKLVGVVFAGLSSGFGEITFLACTSQYNKVGVVQDACGVSSRYGKTCVHTVSMSDSLIIRNQDTVSAWSSGTGGAGILGSWSYIGNLLI
jgi:battenin